MREASSMQTWTNSQPARLPARTCPAAIAGDAVADALESAELLDVDVDHLAGMLALVAAHRLGRLDVLQPRQPGAPQHPADGGGRDADLHGDVLAGQPLAAQGDDALGHGLVGHARHDVGRDERSAMPARPSPCSARPSAPRSSPTRHNVRAAWALERPPSITESAISSRRSGVRRAFLWMFIRTLR